LAELNRKIGINVAGEGGEFESLMVAGPIFKKKIKITDSEIDEESRIIATLKVKKAELA
jgi:asparagine synthase (glutamine-hydrolysing)